jgi:hypothetical protein
VSHHRCHQQPQNEHVIGHVRSMDQTVD